MINTYDNVFSINYAASVWQFVKSSLYKLGWQDSDSLEHSNNLCLHSTYNGIDVKNLSILDELRKHEVSKLVNFDNFQKCVVNLTVPGQTHIEHTHNNEDVLLYYVNSIWNREWAGETLFYSDDGVELEKAVEYKPNRLVFFNGEHPHTIRPPTFEASFYRFTISLFFTRD